MAISLLICEFPRAMAPVYTVASPLPPPKKSHPTLGFGMDCAMTTHPSDVECLRQHFPLEHQPSDVAMSLRVKDTEFRITGTSMELF